MNTLDALSHLPDHPLSFCIIVILGLLLSLAMFDYTDNTTNHQIEDSK